MYISSPTFVNKPLLTTTYVPCSHGGRDMELPLPIKLDDEEVVTLKREKKSLRTWFSFVYNKYGNGESIDVDQLSRSLLTGAKLRRYFEICKIIFLRISYRSKDNGTLLQLTQRRRERKRVKEEDKRMKMKVSP